MLKLRGVLDAVERDGDDWAHAEAPDPSSFGDRRQGEGCGLKGTRRHEAGVLEAGRSVNEGACTGEGMRESAEPVPACPATCPDDDVMPDDEVDPYGPDFLLGVSTTDWIRLLNTVSDLSVDGMPPGVRFKYLSPEPGAQNHLCLAYDEDHRLVASGDGLSEAEARLASCRDLARARRERVTLVACRGLAEST